MEEDFEQIGQQDAQSSGTLQRRIAKALRGTAKRLLPGAAIEGVRRCRTLSTNEQIIYVKAKLLNGIGFADPKRLSSPESVHSIIFVCFGNIMRSPMCEALLSRKLSEVSQRHISVTSAGLNATPGRAAHPWAIAAARKFGVSLEGHRARLLSGEMVERADIIFAMDYQNLAQLLSRWPHARNKVHMLSAYADKSYGLTEISDPYYANQEGTLLCYTVMERCIQNLVDSLLKFREQVSSRTR